MKNIVAIYIAFGLIVSLFAKETFKIGVLAKRGVTKTIERWQPTADYLSKKMRPYSFEIVPLGFNEIYSAVEQKKVDFILANSYYYVALEMKYGVTRIATLSYLLTGETGCSRFGGVIFTKKGSPITDINSLKNRKMAAVDKLSFGGWHMAWREMLKKGIDPFSDLKKITFEGTHDSVVYAVLKGKADVGTARTDTLERMALEKKIDLNDFQIINPKSHLNFPLVVSTDLYPEWPFAKLPHIANNVAKKVAIALLQMEPSSIAAKASHTKGWTVPLDYHSVHACLKELKIGPYEKLREVRLQDILQQYKYWFITALILFIAAWAMTLFFIRLNRQLLIKQKEIGELNKNLEEKVNERTRTLENLNNHLEEKVRTEVEKRREKEQMLIQQSKMAAMGEMIGAIAHQWKQPLNALGLSIQSMLDAYEYDDLSKEDMEEYVNGSMKKIKFLGHTIEDFRNFFKPTKEKVLFNIEEEIKKVIDLVSVQFEKHNIEIEIINGDEKYLASGFPNEFKQVILNLINNSKDAINDLLEKETITQGKIAITFEKLESAIKIILEDSGGGIPEEIMKNIFQPYVTSKGDKGTGIGLYMSKIIIEKNMGGTLSVTNGSDGAVFEITLPSEEK